MIFRKRICFFRPSANSFGKNLTNPGFSCILSSEDIPKAGIFVFPVPAFPNTHSRRTDFTMRERNFTAISYAYIHFAVEVLCFYTVYRAFSGGNLWWAAAVLYDTLAFVPQSIIGAFAETHPTFRPGPAGGVFLLLGAAVCTFGGTAGKIIGLVLLAVGNGFVHIAGAFATLRVSEGRLSESAVFVGGGSFGLITGRLLFAGGASLLLPVLFMLAAVILSVLTDRMLCRIYHDDTYRFNTLPCRHAIAADRPCFAVITILAAVIAVRAYIGYFLPTSWNQTTMQTVFLSCTMGAGKMLGGILSDRFGARRIGIVSCLAAVPVLLLSDRIMWLSLIGVALFSMTMAITLGGLVSVLPENPGTAFGITTMALLLGTVPSFFFPMPPRLFCNLLIAALSVLAAAGLRYTLKPFTYPKPHGDQNSAESEKGDQI